MIFFSHKLIIFFLCEEVLGGFRANQLKDPSRIGVFIEQSRILFGLKVTIDDFPLVRGVHICSGFDTFDGDDWLTALDRLSNFREFDVNNFSK